MCLLSHKAVIVLFLYSCHYLTHFCLPPLDCKFHELGICSCFALFHFNTVSATMRFNMHLLNEWFFLGHLQKRRAFWTIWTLCSILTPRWKYWPLICVLLSYYITLITSIFSYWLLSFLASQWLIVLGMKSVLFICTSSVPKEHGTLVRTQHKVFGVTSVAPTM